MKHIEKSGTEGAKWAVERQITHGDVEWSVAGCCWRSWSDVPPKLDAAATYRFRIKVEPRKLEDLRAEGITRAVSVREAAVVWDNRFGWTYYGTGDSLRMGEWNLGTNFYPAEDTK